MRHGADPDWESFMNRSSDGIARELTVRKSIRAPSMLLIGCICALCFVAVPLRAADTAEDAQTAGPTLQEVVVTGSRIPVPANISATSPTTTVSTQDIQLQGQTDTIEILNALPQNVIAASADLGNQSNPLSSPGGVATADLRGLGPQRTLVLVDGRRLGIGDPNTQNPNPAPDLDQIPAALIERVDVVTGGASAVYGSDATAGVINFIMKKNFQGVQIDGQYAAFMHDNDLTGIQAIDAATAVSTGNPAFNAPSGSTTFGDRRDLSILMGTNIADGNGNVTAYFTYHNQAPVAESRTDYGSCLLVENGLLTGGPLNGFTCLGSSNSNIFIIGPSQTPYSVVGNKFLPYPQTGSSPPSAFNSDTYEYLQRQDERYNAGFMAHIDLNDYVKPYLDFSFMNDRTVEITAPSALFQTSYPFTPDNLYRVNCSNPLLSAQEQSILCTSAQIAADSANPGTAAGLATLDIGRRNIEGGGRLADYEHMNFRTVLGITGDLLPGLTYDAYGSFYYVSLFDSNSNYLNYANVGQALIATGTAGDPVCVNTVGHCVPYNIFTQGGVTPSQLAYLETDGTGYGTTSEGIFHVDFTADMSKWGISSPLAHDGVGLNLGAEHRYDSLVYTPDAALAAGDLAGFTGAVVATNSAFDVNEGFIEARAPLIQDRPFVHDLVVDAGYRYSSYSDVGSTNTYKFELQYAPLPDFRLRYSYDRAVRAPNLIELYNPPSYGQQSFLGTDPCAGTSPSASLTQCEHTGVTPAQYGSIPQCVAGQCGEVIGGNPALKPEQADTYSIGITLTPTMLAGFTASIDYWHIAFFDLIGVYPGATLFESCLTTGNPQYCSQIVRNSVTGALTGATVAGGGYILQTNYNLGTSIESGIDVQASYRLGLGRWGSLTTTLNGTYLEHSISTPYPGAQSFDCAGLFGPDCNTNSVNPRWRHTLRASWQTPWDRLLLSANWRFIGATSLDNNSENPALMFSEFGEYDYIDARIPNYSYLDLAAIWPVWRNIELRAGVNNVLDKSPPIISSELTGVGTPNTYPTFDELGRDLFVAFTAKF
jgi:outer membrane receptor protein involved in Fe transport